MDLRPESKPESDEGDLRLRRAVVVDEEVWSELAICWIRF